VQLLPLASGGNWEDDDDNDYDAKHDAANVADGARAVVWLFCEESRKEDRCVGWAQFVFCFFPRYEGRHNDRRAGKHVGR